MKLGKLIPLLTLPFLMNTSYAAKTKTIQVGVTWASNNTPTYKFVTSGFTQEQSEKIQSSLVYVYYILSQSRSLSNTGALTPFQQCATDNTTRFENPNWMAEDLEIRRYASAVVSSFMVLGGGGGNIKAFTETTAKGDREYVRSGFAPVKTINAEASVEININTNFLDNYSIADIASTLYHEMLHNSGWSHPNNGLASDYPGTFIKETDQCMKAEILRLSASLGQRPNSNKSRTFMMAD